MSPSEDSFSTDLTSGERAIIAEELDILKRLQGHLQESRPRRQDTNYDESLLELRDALGEAHEDEIAQIVDQMTSLATLSGHLAGRYEDEATVNPESPYFGHLRVQQGGRVRDVLLGNRTLTDAAMPLPIIDWRHAPISKVFYLYREGDAYEEEFGGDWVDGEVLARRKLLIVGGRLIHVDCDQGRFAEHQGRWERVESPRLSLGGGAGTALRAGALSAPGALSTAGALSTDSAATLPPPARVGVGHDAPESRLLGGAPQQAQHEDRHLSAITGLMDPAQFEVITKPDSGVVIVDGGAGSGKTTIALHRISYLAYRDPERFQPQHMLVVVYGRALAAYISQLLPALGVAGVRIETFDDLMTGLRQRHFPTLKGEYEENTPTTVLRFKQHPATLTLLDELVAEHGDEIGLGLIGAAAGTDSEARVRDAWHSLAELPLAQRLRRFAAWVLKGEPLPGVGAFREDWLAHQRLTTHLGDRHPHLEDPARMVITLLREAFLSLPRLEEKMGRLAPGEFSPAQLAEVRNWAFLAYAANEDHEAWLIERKEREEQGLSEEPAGDGKINETEPPMLDREDDTLLLLLHTRMVGELRSRRRRALRFQHICVDEAQDFSPLELRVLLGLAAEPRSVTLAGDTDQRMVLQNSFTRWEDVVQHLGLDSTAISPLQVGYRSTAEIMHFARAVLGHLAGERPWIATRPGVPVELLRFTETGQAVAVLSEELITLMRREPSASVALVTRYPGQAKDYFNGLQQADVPGLRHVIDQDFSFRPGIEVTDLQQVKGLEFDYVILLDVDAASYPDDDTSRYLLHIGATRAAHQLSLVTCRAPSPLVPPETPIRLL